MRGKVGLPLLRLLACGVALSGCTEITDLWADGAPSDALGPELPTAETLEDADEPDAPPQADSKPGDQGPQFDLNLPCFPDPCADDNRVCDNGFCGDCLPGYVEDEAGECIPSDDPCVPNPCAGVNKECILGFCGECLPGYDETPEGNCVAPSPCLPNPCTEPLKTTCYIDADGLPYCACAPGTHDDGTGTGTCTFDPCVPNPCTDPQFPTCSFIGFDYECGCPEGQLLYEGGCIADPCVPNPCNEYAKTVCETVWPEPEPPPPAPDPDPDADVGTADVIAPPDPPPIAVCGCELGFVEDESGVGCVEGPAPSLTELPEPEGDVSVGYEQQLFVDDWLVASRAGLTRRLHPTERAEGEGWLVTPDPDAGIGRARANGALVHVPEEVRAAQLPSDHPLRSYAYRMYYMGYRQLFSPDSQPAWLCVAAANDPAGPWVKPAIHPEQPAPNCILRDDGLVLADITLDEGGAWRGSAFRLAIGQAPEAGLYVYVSPDGVTWIPANYGQSLVNLGVEAFPPALYARIGERSRFVWDAWTQTHLGLFALVSPSAGDARGVMFGEADMALGWTKLPSPLQALPIFGPTESELVAGVVLGDMVAWREGSLWLGFVQKRQTACPKTSYAVLVVSRDGRRWMQVRDEVFPTLEAMIPNSLFAGEPDTSVATLSGGRPLTSDGQWHFYSGGVGEDACQNISAEGGVFRTSVRAGGLAGLEASGEGQATLLTPPMVMRDGRVGSTFALNARVDDKLIMQVESLSPVDTILDVVEKVVVAGDYVDEELDMPPVNGVTEGRFRVRFTLTGTGELFGFRFGNPACDPNPCADDPDKPLCDSSSGEAVCVCAPPLHDDGLGGCTMDPCLPDPCDGLYEEGCTDVGGVAECGCEAGFVKANGLCVKDPCVPQTQPDGSLADPCPPPGPNKCRAVGGLAECYCPEGSEPGALGCFETQSRAFVTSLATDAGGIGGVSGADARCQSLASGAGLPGAFAAWISTPAEPAISRFVGGGPWRTWDPEVELWTALVALDDADLADGSVATPIAWTEFGTAAPEGAGVFTGTTPTGKAPPLAAGLGADCATWTAATPGSITLGGRADASDAAWTADAPVACSEQLRLYCFEKPKPQQPEPEPEPEPTPER